MKPTEIESPAMSLPAELAAKLSDSAKTILGQWLEEPRYAGYREKVQALVDAADADTLDAYFWQVIPFGTGGRRGPMGEFGPATINERTIGESAQGLAVYAKSVVGAGQPVSAVIAHDTRNNSRLFAEITARTLAGNGVQVFLFESYRSTPELSFAVRQLNCTVGAMITASHNPPADNGFKAYWSHGGQVLAPHDKGIISAVDQVDEVHMADLEEAVADGRIKIIGDEIDTAFVDAVVALSLNESRSVDALFSPLHGVGETVCYAVATRAGFGELDVYEPHRTPDGNFPNVDAHFPNPERTEVFAPLIEHARSSGAELILASDPDADRLGVVAKSNNGEFVRLSGNQVGAILCDYICTQRSDLTSGNYVVETLVTTPLIGAIAKSHGLQVFDQLLVGFKYIGQTMDAQGPGAFVFGAEESLGYLAGEYARDKCAGIATLYALEAASVLKDAGKTVLDRLDELYVEHGYYYEGQTSKVCPGADGAAQIGQLMDALRTSPPTELGGVTLTEVADYQTHEVRSLPANTKASDLPEPSGNLLFLTGECDDATYRVAVRPSGTEPKIKFYLFAKSPVADAGSLGSVKTSTDAKVGELSSALNAWLDGVLA